jgi:heme/copper-type cytochrome/quinol oxidase subunit 2
MRFEDLQTTWQAHDHANSLQIAPRVLLNEVRRNHRAMELELFRRDFEETVAAFIVAIASGALAIWLTEWTLFLVAASSLFVAGVFAFDRIKQRRKRRMVNDSLLSTVEAAHSQVQHQIWLLSNVFWWYLLPLLIGVFAFLVSCSWKARGGWVEQLIIAFVAVICIFAFLIAYRINQRYVLRTLAPRRIELEELLATLTSNSEQSSEQ